MAVKFAWPMPNNKRISSGYGYRGSPINGKQEFHTGIDLPAPEGTSVKSIAAGIVSYSGSGVRGYGNCVAVNHGKLEDGYYYASFYGHNSSLSVKKNAEVRCGQEIAKCGSTGYSTGPHVHLDLYRSKSPIPDGFTSLHVNPSSYLAGSDAEVNVPQGDPNKVSPPDVPEQGGYPEDDIEVTVTTSGGSSSSSSSSSSESTGDSSFSMPDPWGQDNPWTGLDSSSKAAYDAEKQAAYQEARRKIDFENNLYIDLSQEIVEIPRDFLENQPKYMDVRQLDGLQHDPRKMKKEEFKQDYVIIIRKKLYYAQSAVEGQDVYTRLYHINNYSSIRTSHNIYGRSGSCNITLVGGERVTKAEREDQDTKNWEDWKEIIMGWTNIDDEGQNDDGEIWRVGEDYWNSNKGNQGFPTRNVTGIDYKNIMKAKEAKYGWCYAEKADWEPMDEIMIYAKTRNKGDANHNYRQAWRGGFTFMPIFFGYIDSISKTYTAGKGGAVINITASDQIKLLELGQVLTTMNASPGKSSAVLDLSFETDAFKLFKILNPTQEAGMDTDGGTRAKATTLFDNVFCGWYVHEIIETLCIQSGIPKNYLTERIEKIKTVPFVTRLANKNSGDLFSAQSKKRSDMCREAAEKLFLEFFADEGGNIVLKIPSYALGANKLPANNMNLNLDHDKLCEDIYDEALVESDEDGNVYTAEQIAAKEKANYKPGEEVEKIYYEIKDGDTLQSISKEFNKTSILSSTIYQNNKNVLSSQSAKLPVGEKIVVYKYDGNNVNATANAARMMALDMIDERTESFKDSSGKEWKVKMVNGTPLSAKTDQLIPQITEEHLISFTVTDSDKEVYNMIEIQGETFLDAGNSSNVLTNLKRVVPDINSILRFGFRPHPGVVNTPLVNSDAEAEMFGMLLINKSLSNRYTGSITLVEDSAIHVGDPIRLFMYDEHPQKETGKFDKNKYYGQAVFYITGIERSISPNSVSTMTLSVNAGRTMGQESIFDLCYLIYKYYYKEKIDLTEFLNSEQLAIKEKYESNSKTYVCKPEDTIAKILEKECGVTSDSPDYQEKLSALCLINPDIFSMKDISNISYISSSKLVSGLEIKLPK